VGLILIVDDEYFIREVAVSTVEELGYDVLSACDVDEAMSYLRSNRKIDALITDIRLKSALHGGYEIAQDAVKIRPSLRVLYMTGSPITDEMRDLFVEGAHLLQKPYSPDQLRNSLEKLFAAPV
jgi:CheY-like chemotaxis protein